MKKVLLTISRGSIARNLLQNVFYTQLREKYHVVLLTTAADDGRFQQQFAHPNVTFLTYEEKEQGAGDRLLFWFHKHLIYNPTVAQKDRWASPGDPRTKQPTYASYLCKKALFTVLSKIRWLRDFVRWLDLMFLQKDEVAFFLRLLTKHKPDIVISTNVSSDTEAALLKASKKQHIPTVAMPKSWDNSSKFGFRCKADYIVVWSLFVRDQAVGFQNYRPEQVWTIGVPQFDCYADQKRRMDRRAFCERYGLDPDKKIIFFGSEGKLFPNDSEIASILYDYAQSRGYQLLVRPHFGYKQDEKKFSHLLGKPGAAVDLFNQPSALFRDEWDYSIAFMDRFLNSLYYSDVIVNTCSTLSLDGVAFDKPIISIGFDGYVKKPYHESIARWYETFYYRGVIETGGVHIAQDKDDLSQTLDRYLAAPETDATGRERLRTELCGPIDGKAGERFFTHVEAVMNNTVSRTGI